MVPLRLETSLLIVVHFQTTSLISYGETKFTEDFVQKSMFKPIHCIKYLLKYSVFLCHSFPECICPSGQRKCLMKIKLFKKANFKVIARPTYARQQ